MQLHLAKCTANQVNPVFSKEHDKYGNSRITHTQNSGLHCLAHDHASILYSIMITRQMPTASRGEPEIKNWTFGVVIHIISLH